MTRHNTPKYIYDDDGNPLTERQCSLNQLAFLTEKFFRREQIRSLMKLKIRIYKVIDDEIYSKLDDEESDRIEKFLDPIFEVLSQAEAEIMHNVDEYFDDAFEEVPDVDVELPEHEKDLI